MDKKIEMTIVSKDLIGGLSQKYGHRFNQIFFKSELNGEVELQRKLLSDWTDRAAAEMDPFLKLKFEKNAMEAYGEFFRALHSLQEELTLCIVSLLLDQIANEPKLPALWVDYLNSMVDKKS